MNQSSLLFFRPQPVVQDFIVGRIGFFRGLFLPPGLDFTLNCQHFIYNQFITLRLYIIQIRNHALYSPGTAQLARNGVAEFIRKTQATLSAIFSSSFARAHWR